jgi:hypothetical protein
MTEDIKEPQNKKGSPKKHRSGRRLLIAGVIIAIAVCIAGTGALIYNNISLCNDQVFAKRLDQAIEKAVAWIETHKQEILKARNVALLRMLKEIEDLGETPVFSEIVEEYMATPSWPRCWKRLIDPNWPVDRVELNMTIEKAPLDSKWTLYALDPDKANVTGQELGLFDPDRWQHRKLTHQLDALIVLRDSQDPNETLNILIEHLCHRLSRELPFDLAVADIYIQKIAFILRAALPDKIRRRWVERIVANQRSDGGWSQSWFHLTSDRVRPVLRSLPSDQHATIQAIVALYLVKYRYGEHFGLR